MTVPVIKSMNDDGVCKKASAKKVRITWIDRLRQKAEEQNISLSFSRAKMDAKFKQNSLFQKCRYICKRDDENPILNT